MIRTMDKGERLPKHKFKEFSYLTASDFVYNLYDADENHIATLYKPRWPHLPRRIELASTGEQG